ncbi:APC family permease [Oceanithermus desulfurans]|nr:APC family permease [Oceanithermus desulfurans]MBB6030204.1 amino acid transporter [Oceanithermus desulfurans]
MKPTRGNAMGLWEAVAMAVGTMIGASIFTMLGLGAKIAGPNLPLVFVLSGLLALFVAYSYAHLGKRYVSNAGPIEFIVRGVGDSVVTGALAILFWFSFVVSIALFAKGFAGYFLPLVHLPVAGLAQGWVEAGVVAAFTALNFFGSKAVGRAEFWIVLIKLSVLGVFVVLGIWTVHPEWVTPRFDPEHLRGTLYGAAIFFLSYMGFGLVTNASENLENPEVNVPRAIYLSILIVSVVYISVALVAVGNVALPELLKAEEYALAEAAKPFLGAFGYVLVSLGALFSISSALNATLYGGANIAYALARQGELPAAFERKVWFSATEGLYATAVLGLLFALAFDLSGIAGITSSVMIMIYLFVFVAHYRLLRAGQADGRSWFVVLSFVVVASVFLMLQVYQWNQGRAAFWATFAAFGLALVFEAAYRGLTRRAIRRRGPDA